MSLRPAGQTRQAGFTLVEALVSTLVIAIGLLGVAGMQYTGLKDSNRSNERSIATILTYDLVDRMRSNPQAAFGGDYLLSATTTPGAPGKDCIGTDLSGICSSEEMAQADLYDWHNSLGTQLVAGRASVGCADADNSDALPCSPGSVHSIRVMWDERRTGATGTDCDNSKPETELFCLSMDVQI